MKYRYLLFVCVITNFKTIAQGNIEIDFVEASPTLSIDLDKSPSNFGKNLVPAYFDLLSAMNNQEIGNKFEKDLKKYLTKLETKLPVSNGQLVQVRIKSNEFGTKFIPTDFLLPSGVGVDPIDAYSEYYNTPMWQPESFIDGATIDESYYLWIYKTNYGLTVSNIPVEFRIALITKGKQVAMEKVSGKEYAPRIFASSFTSYLDRMAFWNDKYKSQEQLIKQSQLFEKIRGLNNSFTLLQAEQVTLVQKFESIVNKIKADNSFLKTVETLLKVSSMAIKYLRESPVDQTSEKLIIVDSKTETLYSSILEHHVKMLEKEAVKLKEEIKLNNTKLLETDKQLKYNFNLLLP